MRSHHSTNIKPISVCVEILSHTTPNAPQDILLLVNSIELAEQLGAAQLVSCKSAKDRTSMLVTHIAALRAAAHSANVSDSNLTARGIANALRVDGVRRQNCSLNTGTASYAFNDFQSLFLPPELRPPPETLSGIIET